MKRNLRTMMIGMAVISCMSLVSCGVDSENADELTEFREEGAIEYYEEKYGEKPTIERGISTYGISLFGTVYDGNSLYETSNKEYIYYNDDTKKYSDNVQTEAIKKDIIEYVEEKVCEEVQAANPNADISDISCFVDIDINDREAENLPMDLSTFTTFYDGDIERFINDEEFDRFNGEIVVTGTEDIDWDKTGESLKPLLMKDCKMFYIDVKCMTDNYYNKVYKGTKDFDVDSDQTFLHISTNYNKEYVEKEESEQ